MNLSIKIIDFREKLAEHFARLNKAWLQKYFTIEPVDEEMLSNPKHFFIDAGGYIFFAEIDGVIAGTFALIKNENNIFELSKMAVDEQYQGLKIGNKMIEFCIVKAKELKITKIILYSNTKLKPAIHLYNKYGFIEVPIINSIYKRSDIKMELVIN